MGSVTAFPANLFDGSNRFVGVTVDTDAEMTPRVQVLSVPYAFRAEVADSVTGIDDDYVNVTGDTMTGTLTMDNGVIRSNVAEGASARGFQFETNDYYNTFGSSIFSVNNSSEEVFSLFQYEYPGLGYPVRGITVASHEGSPTLSMFVGDTNLGKSAVIGDIDRANLLIFDSNSRTAILSNDILFYTRPGGVMTFETDRIDVGREASFLTLNASIDSNVLPDGDLAHKMGDTGAGWIFYGDGSNLVGLPTLGDLSNYVRINPPSIQTTTAAQSIWIENTTAGGKAISAEAINDGHAVYGRKEGWGYAGYFVDGNNGWGDTHTLYALSTATSSGAAGYFVNNENSAKRVKLATGAKAAEFVGEVTIEGDVYADNFYGDGSQLTGIDTGFDGGTISGLTTFESNASFEADVFIAGKLTVVGTIDPIALILDPKDTAGQSLRINEVGDPLTEMLYFSQEDGLNVFDSTGNEAILGVGDSAAEFIDGVNGNEAVLATDYAAGEFTDGSGDFIVDLGVNNSIAGYFADGAGTDRVYLINGAQAGLFVGEVSIEGDVYAEKFYGDGSGLTGLTVGDYVELGPTSGQSTSAAYAIRVTSTHASGTGISAEADQYGGHFYANGGGGTEVGVYGRGYYGVRGVYDSDSDRFGELGSYRGSGYGVYGQYSSTVYGGIGGLGDANKAAIVGRVTAAGAASDQYGGYFSNSRTSGTAVGVYGASSSSGGYGVRGINGTAGGIAISGYASDSSASANYGGSFSAGGETGRGVYGLASAGSGVNYGGYFETNSASGYAAKFVGDVTVEGDVYAENFYGDGSNLTGIAAPGDLNNYVLKGGDSMTGTLTMSVSAAMINKASNRFMHSYGTNNTFVGELAGNFTTSGSGLNTGLGSRALYSVSTGLGNVAVGRNVLDSLADGSTNTAIGFSAGDNLVSGSGNVFIGNRAGDAETGSNKLYISNSSSNNLIYGEFNNDLVRINGTLEVTSDIVVTGNVTAAAYYGDGSNLTGIAGDGIGISTVDADARYVNLDGDSMTGVLTVSANVTVEGTLGIATTNTYGLDASINNSSGFAVRGQNISTNGSIKYGGYFTADGAGGRGIFASAVASTGTNYGGFFETDTSGSGTAVRGDAKNTGAVLNIGGNFTAGGTTGIAVKGTASGTGTSYGGKFSSSGDTGYGVLGQVSGSGINYGGAFTSNSSSGVGLYAYNSGGGQAALFGSGNVQVNNDLIVNGSLEAGQGATAGNFYVGGTLSKAAGTFLIDHPLDPANKVLRHSFVESPDMKNVYDGTIYLNDKGEAVVELPDYFEALNKDFRYQLTTIGNYAPVFIKQKIKGNKFLIAGGKPGMEVCWQITGSRQDAFAKKNPVIVEEEKAVKGVYLHPAAFNENLSLEQGY